jgi:thiosulfate/3-mercaptopyruvate sulfurtransferase
MNKILTSAKDYIQYSNSGILISPEKTSKIITSAEGVVLLDIRTPADFKTGHIKGAYQIWRPDFSASKGEYEYNGMRATREKLAETLGDYGISRDTYVILISADSNLDAARLWWLMDIYGHEKMALVDGGIDGWKQAGLPVVRELSPKPKTVVYKFPRGESTSRLGTIEDIKNGIESEDVVILDTRTNFEHDGLVQFKGAFAKGRIPSEHHIEWNKMVNKDKTFKSREEIERILTENGITKDKTIIPYCQAGVRSAHTTFVLSELLGWKNIKNYDGSWIEWSYNAVNGKVELENPNLSGMKTTLSPDKR